MIEIIFCVGVFVWALSLYLIYSQICRIYSEQNKLIENLMGENGFMLKEHTRDIEMLDWADKAGHHDARCESLRDELRTAMGKYNAKTNH